jgi:DNA-binding transcriptional LysR family regulator
MRNYTLKQMLAFIEVARDRSVSKAATRLFVTQPAVSMQLRQLEEAFGLPLVEPSGRNIKLTQAGEEFLKHAIAAVAQLRNLEASMAEHVGLKKGRIELAVVSTVKYFVPMLLVRFSIQVPGIEVKLHIDNRENILSRLSRNEVDLVIMGRAPPRNWTARPRLFAATRWALSVRRVIHCRAGNTLRSNCCGTMALSCASRAPARVPPWSGCLHSTVFLSPWSWKCPATRPSNRP